MVCTDKQIIILGAGGHANVVSSILRQLEHPVVGYLSPEPTALLAWPSSIPWLGNDDMLSTLEPAKFVLVNGIGSVGKTDIRKRIFLNAKHYGYKFMSVIHPSAIVSDDIAYGEGALIMAGVIIQPNVKLGDNVLLNTGSIVDHDTYIGSHSHIAPGVCISGGVHIGNSVHIGTRAALRNGIQIQDNAVVGVGAAVVSNVDAGSCVVGIPARPI